jgi:hypothetical protein
MQSVTSNAVYNFANKIIKYKDVVFGMLTVGAGGYFYIGDYKPTDMNNFLFALLHHYGLNSANGAIGVNSDASYFFATANSTTDNVTIRYYYTD